jgi:hypothetical protein
MLYFKINPIDNYQNRGTIYIVKDATFYVYGVGDSPSSFMV